MSGFFNRSYKIHHDLDLVSIHIPKTAGTSFRNFLKLNYGEENAARFDINVTTKRIDLENREFKDKRLPSHIRVIHGHFYYSDLIRYIRLKDIPLITWLRDPAERVISNYYYLAGRLKEELEEEKKGLNILAKMQRSLIEYARNEISRNRISKFLEGSHPENYKFIGIYEYYNEDIHDLAEILGIQDVKIFQHNITGEKADVDPEVLRQIRELNEEDYTWYRKALELRAQRRSKTSEP